MKQIIYIISLACLTICLFAVDVVALERAFSGRLIGWLDRANDYSDWRNDYGLGYIPQLIIEQPLDVERLLDVEVSFKNFTSQGVMVEDDYLKLYRFYGRYTTPQTETRLGLQQINFGPAFMLRSLRWFDSLDPRDPLRLTDGVYALRFRYNALNNANLWLWGLYGNDDLKGFEIFPSVSNRPELGGRYQYPVPSGEIAASIHTRRTDYFGPSNEIRFAIDGRWDIEIGLWFEAVLQQQDIDNPPLFSLETGFNEWTKTITLGLDYTLPIGNGLYVLAEHMAYIMSDETFGSDYDRQFSAFSVNYPLTLFDNLSAIGFLSMDDKELFSYLSWQRTYDNLIVNLSLYRYPRLASSFAGLSRGVSISGYGARLMLIWNH
jgi:hypothetical protein